MKPFCDVDMTRTMGDREKMEKNKTIVKNWPYPNCVQDPAKPDLRAVAEALAAHAGGEHSDAAAQGLLQALGVQDGSTRINTDAEVLWFFPRLRTLSTLQTQNSSCAPPDDQTTKRIPSNT